MPYDPLLKQLRRGPATALPGGPPTGPAGGDLTGTYPNPTLVIVNPDVGTFGDATHVARVTVDAKGRITAISLVPITYPVLLVDGDPGEDGPPGPPGAQGAQGATGQQGPVGPPGADGEDGETGPVGPTGAQGVPGPAGQQGQTGTPGIDGEEGPAGEVGPPGPPGTAGTTGAQGPMGPAGFPGEDGQDGLDGAPGQRGADGVTGNTGAVGPAVFLTVDEGEDGPAGPPGPPGPTGATGATGSTGSSGAPGIDGQDGSGDEPLGFSERQTGVVAGVYGSASLIPQVTVDASGRVTNATNVVPTLALNPQFPVISTHEYIPSYTNGASSTLNTVAGVARIAIFYPVVGVTYDRLRVNVANASNSVARIVIYEMNPNTWLPISVILDAGTVSWTGTGGDRTIAISQLASVAVWGLCFFVETVTATNPNVTTCSIGSVDIWPPGRDGSAGAIGTSSYYRIEATGQSAGAAPPFGNFVLTAAAANNATVQPLVCLRVA